MRQAVSIIVLYALINILSLLFNIISFSTDGKIDIGFPFIFIHLTSAKYDSTFPYNKLLIEPFLWDIIFLFTIVCLYLCCLKIIKRMYLKGKAFGSGKTKRILNKEFDIGKSIVIQGASLKAKVAEHTIDTAIDKRDNKKNVKREK